MVDFGGWDMPVQYSGVLEEHHAVRKSAGLNRRQPHGRDRGSRPRSLEASQLHRNQRRLEKLKPGQAHYSAMLYEHGGFVDDILVHKVADDHFFLCVNASNQDKDYEHIVTHNTFNATVENVGDRYAQLAIQGPSRAGDGHCRGAHLRGACRYRVLSFCRRHRERHSGAHRADGLHRRGLISRSILRPLKQRVYGLKFPAAGSEFRSPNRAA